MDPKDLLPFLKKTNFLANLLKRIGLYHNFTSVPKDEVAPLLASMIVAGALEYGIPLRIKDQKQYEEHVYVLLNSEFKNYIGEEHFEQLIEYFITPYANTADLANKTGDSKANFDALIVGYNAKKTYTKFNPNETIYMLNLRAINPRTQDPEFPVLDIARYYYVPTGSGKQFLLVYTVDNIGVIQFAYEPGGSYVTQAIQEITWGMVEYNLPPPGTLTNVILQGPPEFILYAKSFLHQHGYNEEAIISLDVPSQFGDRIQNDAPENKWIVYSP